MAKYYYYDNSNDNDNDNENYDDDDDDDKRRKLLAMKILGWSMSIVDCQMSSIQYPGQYGVQAEKAHVVVSKYYVYFVSLHHSSQPKQTFVLFNVKNIDIVFQFFQVQFLNMNLISKL